MAKNYSCAPEISELLQRNDGWRQFHHDDARKEIHSLLATRQIVYRGNRMLSRIGLDAIDRVHEFPVCAEKPNPVPSTEDTKP